MSKAATHKCVNENRNEICFRWVGEKPVRYVYLLESTQIHMSPVTRAMRRELCRLAETRQSMSIFFMLNFVCGMFRWIRYRINECVYDFWLKRPKKNKTKNENEKLFILWFEWFIVACSPSPPHSYVLVEACCSHSSTPFYFALDIKLTDRQLTYYQIISIDDALLLLI